MRKNFGTFYEKELQKANQTKFRIEKLLKKKGEKLYFKWKGYDNSLNSWIDKKRHSLTTDEYFLKPCEHYSGNLKIKVDLSNYARK